jgi:(S)-mandelate dehydrogenase
VKRKYYTGTDVNRALSIEELRRMARRRLPAFALEFLESGGEDELSLAWNREIFRTFRFLPDTLVDTSARSIRTRLFDRELPSPLIVAPTGHNGIYRRDGDVLLAKAAASMGVPFTLGTLSNTRVERLAKEVSGPLWFQLYQFANEQLTLDIVSRAKAADYEVLVFTTDCNVFGWREWDRRHFRAPGQLTLRSLCDAMLHPRWFFDVIVPHGVPRLENVVDSFPPDARDTRSAISLVPKLFEPTITWKTVAKLRDLWPRKLVIKGILSVEDARRAVEHGCDGIVLSNHGARHLDSVVSPIEVLPEIAAAVGNRLAVLIDGGFRRGGDIVKAIALGAHAVMIGRATLYGLAAGGEPGVRRAIELLHSEVDRVLGQLGCVSLKEVGPHLLSTGAGRPTGVVGSTSAKTAGFAPALDGGRLTALQRAAG